MLFIAAGSVIHAFLDQQDLRRYGGLVQVMPVVYSALVIGSLSLMAVPYLTGWYSKDGILEVAVGSYTVPGSFVYIVGTVVAGLTAYYSVRLVVLTFLTGPRSDYASYSHAHDSTAVVMVPLVVLSLLSILLGYTSSDLFRGMGTDMLAASSPISPSMVASVDAEFAGITLYKLAPFIATVTGSLLAYWGYNTGHGVEALARLFEGAPVMSLYRYLSAQWQFDALIISGVIVPGLRLGHSLSKVFDRGILEAMGPYGLQRNFTVSGNLAGVYSTGVLTDYAMFIVLAMLAGVVLFALPTIGFLSGLLPAGFDGATGMAMVLLVNGVSAYLVSKGNET